MATKLIDLAKKFDLSAKELRDRLKQLGFEVKATAKTVEDEVVKKLTDSFENSKKPVMAESNKSVSKDNGWDAKSISHSDDSSDLLIPDEKFADTAEVYGEIIEEQLEREIVKEQRKKTAGQITQKGGKSGSHGQHIQAQQRQEFKLKTGIVEIPDVISVKEFSEKIGVGPVKVIGELMKNGILANINQQIDFDTAQIIASDLHVEIKRKRSDFLLDDALKGNLKAFMQQDETADLKPRPPIVVIMGHVDHGKTTLLDYIRETNVAAKEAGGITQHIAAYQVEKNDRKITFLDTPGHEAFTAMRARGAKVTDIAVLVVAADEGIMPQTIEAIHHAQEAEVPIIVALTKIDKPHTQIDRIKGQLAEHGLQPEEWGGKTPIVGVSAVTGQGTSELLEMILLISDMENLRANPNREAVATVIEANLDKSMGPIATIVINTGTLKVMDYVVVGASYGRIKAMKDQYGKNLQSAPPSMPVLISGLSSVPESGDILQAATGGERSARERALQFATVRAEEMKAKPGGLSDIISQIHAGSLKTLKVVLKADTRGSLEAIQQALMGVKHEDVAIKIIHSAVGNVTESDVMMAAASGGIVIGFHVNSSPHLQLSAERHGVEILMYTIIYKLVEDLKNLLSGLLEPEILEVILGRAEVKQIFFQKKNELIAGCSVASGKIENKTKLRVFRGDQQVGEGEILNLKKFENQVKEVAEGNDCGIKFTGNVVLQAGDILESYKMERKKRTLA